MSCACSGCRRRRSVRRVIVPYAANQEREHPGLYPQVVEALAEHCPVEPQLVDVSRTHESYFELLQASWADATDDLVLIEHDIVVHDRVFTMFKNCSRPWCAFPYDMAATVQPGLGCTRFRKRILAEQTGIWGAVARHGNDAQVPDGLPSRHWLRCDVRLDAELMPLGYAPHVHLPKVEHLNPWQRLKDTA